MAMQGMQGAQGQQGTQPQMQAGPTPRINIQEFENKLDAMPDSSLKQLAQNPSYMTNAMYGPLINAELTRRVAARQAKQTQQTPQGQQPTVVQQAQQTAQQLPEDTGIAQLPAQNIANMAGGGIVAFAGGGDMEDGEVEYDPSMDIRQGEEYDIALGGEGADEIEQIPQPQKILKDATTPIGRQIQQFFLGGQDPQAKADEISAHMRAVGRPPTRPDLRVEDRFGDLLFSKIRQAYEPRSGLRGKFTSQSQAEYQRANDIMAQATALREKGDIEGLQALVGELFTPESAKTTGTTTTPGRVVPGFKPEEPASAAPKPAAPRAQAAPRGPAGALPGAAPAGLAATAPGQAALEAPKPPTFNFDYEKAKKLEEAELQKVQDARKAKLAADIKEWEAYRQQRGEYGKGREERLNKQEEGLAKRREEAQGMALLEVAAGIFAAPPGRGAIAALGVGMQRGLKSYQGDIEKLQAAADKIQAARDALEDIRYKEADATDAQRRAYRSEQRQITIDGAKGYQELARRYGVEMPMKQAVSDFEKALRVWEVQTKEAGDTAREQMRQSGATLREGMGNAASLQAAGIRAAGVGGTGRRDEQVYRMAEEAVADRLKLKPNLYATPEARRIAVNAEYQAILNALGRGKAGDADLDLSKFGVKKLSQ